MDGSILSAVGVTLCTAQRVPRAFVADQVDAYEAVVRLITDLERAVARTAQCEPLRLAAAGLADLTRDTAAVQVSTVRWTLDL